MLISTDYSPSSLNKQDDPRIRSTHFMSWIYMKTSRFFKKNKIRKRWFTQIHVYDALPITGSWRLLKKIKNNSQKVPRKKILTQKCSNRVVTSFQNLCGRQSRRNTWLVAFERTRLEGAFKKTINIDKFLYIICK